jgi:S1-C subfamily serine protease
VSRGRIRTALVAVGLSAALTGCVSPPPAEIIGATPPEGPIDQAADNVLRIRSVGNCETAVGSGFVVDGHLVTNRHVIEGASTIEVETWDGRPVAIDEGSARVGVDTDLGIIDLPRRSQRRIEALPLAEEDASAGASMVAVGYAMAGPAVTTRGQFLDSAPGRRFGEPGPVLRMNASVRPGNSGGPLLDDDANVVGVIFAYEVATLHALAVPRERLESVLADPQALQPVTPC